MRHDCFIFNDTATTEIYTLSLHDALPISDRHDFGRVDVVLDRELAARDDTLGLVADVEQDLVPVDLHDGAFDDVRSEEHTSELQSRQYLVCRLLLEKKKTKKL